MTKEQQREYNRRKHEEAKPAYEALMSCYPFTLDDLPGEIWKDIDEHYQISTFGRVKSFWGKTPRIRKPELLGDYLSVDLYIDGEKKQRRVHVLVAQAFIPNPLNKPEVNHRVGCKFNYHVENLEWATNAENQQHAVKNGLSKSGVDRSDAKIKNEADIIYIRENPNNLTQDELAAMFGVKPNTIGRIQRGNRYPNAGGKIRKARKRSPNMPDETKQKIRADWATGLYTKAALARKFGCDRKTIYNVINAGQ